MNIGCRSMPTTDDPPQVTSRILPDSMDMKANSSNNLSPHTHRGTILQTMRIRQGRVLYNMVLAGNG